MSIEVDADGHGTIKFSVLFPSHGKEYKHGQDALMGSFRRLNAHNTPALQRTRGCLPRCH